MDLPISLFLRHSESRRTRKCPIHIVNSANRSPFPKEFLLSTRVRQGIEKVKLFMTPATAQEDTINKMWSEYMKESGEYDKRVTDVWRKDASDILIFVSPKYNGSTRLS
jgi:hypothetical protein